MVRIGSDKHSNYPFLALTDKHTHHSAGCSAYFVQISPSPDDKSVSNENKSSYGTMRTCKMCHDHLAERGLGVMMRAGGTEKDAPKQDINVDAAKKSSQIQVEDGDGDIGNTVASANPPLVTPQPTAGDILLPMVSSLPDQDANQSTHESLIEQFAGMHSDEIASGGFHALSTTKQRLDNELGEKQKENFANASKEERGVVAAAAAIEGEACDGLDFKLKNNYLRLKSSTDVENEIVNSKTINTNIDTMAVSDQKVTIPSESCGVEEAVSHQGQSKDVVQKASQHLGMMAADYLEKLCRELLQTDAPFLLQEIKTATLKSPLDETSLTNQWVETLMTMATRCCSTVEPDVMGGDFLDIRPYCKVKTISGGSVEDCAYMSGIAFHNNVTDKKMSKVVNNAKIMLLSGGIEFTRTGRVSFDALLEQEERYMEILVSKIFKLKANVLLVGRSVSRKAQELLLRANIALVQYVKPTLMTRIARQTGATILSSIDHLTNGDSIMGYCKRFRIVAFRDNDIWIDSFDESTNSECIEKAKKCVSSLLSQNLPNHERQAVLAASKLGQGVFEGNEAVKSGLMKRGVVKTYVMIEGCPKELGCTVIIRGVSRPALKQVKKVLRFMINAVSRMCLRYNFNFILITSAYHRHFQAYNMKLETSYIIERSARLPASYTIPAAPCSSSSLCIDFGQPPNNRKIRPWNGSQKDERRPTSISGKITPLDHQAILITSVWMTDKTQCCPAEVKGICYYSMQDVSLGQFLRDRCVDKCFVFMIISIQRSELSIFSCFNLALKCQNPSCKKSVIDHSLSFIHNDGVINITVESMDNPIPTSSLKKQPQDDIRSPMKDKRSGGKDANDPIATWTFCMKCQIVVTPLQFISKQTWQW